MLKTLIDIITTLGLVDGKLSVMTENQLDEFARNIPNGKVSCNIFGIGGYDRNESNVLRKQVRICLLKQMPVNYDLGDVDTAEASMTGLLLQIQDALRLSMFINIENETGVTPELLKYDRTVLLTYFDCFVFGNASVCGSDPCVPAFLKAYVASIVAATDTMLSNAIGFEIRDDLNLWMTMPDDYTGVEFEIQNGNLVAIN